MTKKTIFLALAVAFLVILPLTVSSVRHLEARSASPYIVLDTLHVLAGSGSDGKYPTNSMIIGDDGHLYGTTGWGSSSNSDGTFYKVVTTGPAYDATSTYTILHTFNNGSVE